MIYFLIVSSNQFSGSHAESLGFKIWTINAAGNIYLFCNLFTQESYFHYMETILVNLICTDLQFHQRFCINLIQLWPVCRLTRNHLTSNFKCWATKVNYPWETDFVLYWMPESTKGNKKHLSPTGACISSKCSIWFPSVKLTYQNHWSDSWDIQQVFRNYYSLPCWDGLRL